MELIERLERLGEQATKRPWYYDDSPAFQAEVRFARDDGSTGALGFVLTQEPGSMSVNQAEHDADFIATAANAVEPLCAALRVALAALEAVQHNRLCACYAAEAPCPRCEVGYDAVDSALAEIRTLLADAEAKP